MRSPGHSVPDTHRGRAGATKFAEGQSASDTHVPCALGSHRDSGQSLRGDQTLLAGVHLDAGHGSVDVQTARARVDLAEDHIPRDTQGDAALGNPLDRGHCAIDAQAAYAPVNPLPTAIVLPTPTIRAPSASNSRAATPQPMPTLLTPLASPSDPGHECADTQGPGAGADLHNTTGETQ